MESIVKYARLNYFVPVPEVDSFEELNAYLEERCREDLERRVRGAKSLKKELLREDQDAFVRLPFGDFDPCRQRSTTVDRLSLVRFDSNDYSVPVRHAHCQVVAKGYVDRVRICRNEQVIAEHARLWGKEGIAFEPLHYLELLERKPGALDQAKPLSEWVLPECFHLLRHRLEQEGQRRGTREYIRVLRLLEKHPLSRVEAAISKALCLRYCHRDVVAQYLYPEQPVTSFSLEGREHLKGVYVAPPDLKSYQKLMGGLPL